MASIRSINTSRNKGERKSPAGSAALKAGHGIEGDGHAGDWHRQVSLLAMESIEKMRDKGLDVGPGDFAENITTEGIDLLGLPVGTRVRLGAALIEVTQHGKECHAPCEIYHQAGDCVMPSEGIFAIVITGGKISAGDEIVPDNNVIPRSASDEIVPDNNVIPRSAGDEIVPDNNVIPRSAGDEGSAFPGG